MSNAGAGTLSAMAVIAAGKPSGYLQQLCKHFGHKVPVDFTPEAGAIAFDFGRADLAADAEALTLRVDAADADDLEKLKRVITSHLERFAFREELKIEWNA